LGYGFVESPVMMASTNLYTYPVMSAPGRDGLSLPNIPKFLPFLTNETNSQWNVCARKHFVFHQHHSKAQFWLATSVLLLSRSFVLTARK